MKIRKILLLFIFLFSTALAMGQQGYIYSYLDPCTAKAKEIYVDTSGGSVPLTYNGQIRSFSDSELQSGAFQTWIESVNAQNPNGPCSSVALVQSTTLNVQVAANNISVITTVMSTLSSMAAMQDVVTSTTDAVASMSGNSISGIIQSDEKVSSNNDNKEDNKNENSSNPNNNNGTTTTASSGSTSNSGTNQTKTPVQGTQTSNTGTGGSSSNQGNSNTTSTNATSTGSQSSQSSVTDNTSKGSGANLTGTIGSLKVDNAQQSESSDKAEGEAKAENAVSSAASSSSSAKSKVAAVKQGSLMMNGDIVTIASASNEPSQFKINASIISSNTKNTFAKGALINFTSYVNNSNITLFVSYRHKNLTSIFANSMMMNFEKDFFNTASIMESYKTGKITSTIGVNLTMGNIGTSKFTSLSTLAGVFSTFKVNKKIGLTTMFVAVYSPYVFYYEGMWCQSKLLLVPFVAVDYKLTKKFKVNVSFSGVQQMNDKAISYQILTGAKCLL